MSTRTFGMPVTASRISASRSSTGNVPPLLSTLVATATTTSSNSLRRALDQVQVAVGDRIEARRVHRDALLAHAGPHSRRPARPRSRTSRTPSRRSACCRAAAAPRRVRRARRARRALGITTRLGLEQARQSRRTPSSAFAAIRPRRADRRAPGRSCRPAAAAGRARGPGPRSTTRARSSQLELLQVRAAARAGRRARARRRPPRARRARAPRCRARRCPRTGRGRARQRLRGPIQSNRPARARSEVGLVSRPARRAGAGPEAPRQRRASTLAPVRDSSARHPINLATRRSRRCANLHTTADSACAGKRGATVLNRRQASLACLARAVTWHGVTTVPRDIERVAPDAAPHQQRIARQRTRARCEAKGARDGRTEPRRVRRTPGFRRPCSRSRRS